MHSNITIHFVAHRRSQRTKVPRPSTFLEFFVRVCSVMRCPKQNAVARLKSTDWPSPKFGLATPLVLRHHCVACTCDFAVVVFLLCNWHQIVWSCSESNLLRTAYFPFILATASALIYVFDSWICLLTFSAFALTFSILRISMLVDFRPDDV